MAQDVYKSLYIYKHVGWAQALKGGSTKTPVACDFQKQLSQSLAIVLESDWRLTGLPGVSLQPRRGSESSILLLAKI